MDKPHAEIPHGDATSRGDSLVDSANVLIDLGAAVGSVCARDFNVFYGEAVLVFQREINRHDGAETITPPAEVREGHVA
jgi:hypothetical protein